MPIPQEKGRNGEAPGTTRFGNLDILRLNGNIDSVTVNPFVYAAQTRDIFSIGCVVFPHGVTTLVVPVRERKEGDKVHTVRVSAFSSCEEAIQEASDMLRRWEKRQSDSPTIRNTTIRKSEDAELEFYTEEGIRLQEEAYVERRREYGGVEATGAAVDLRSISLTMASIRGSSN